MQRVRRRLEDGDGDRGTDAPAGLSPPTVSQAPGGARPPAGTVARDLMCHVLKRPGQAGASKKPRAVTHCPARAQAQTWQTRPRTPGPCPSPSSTDPPVALTSLSSVVSCHLKRGPSVLAPGSTGRRELSPPTAAPGVTGRGPSLSQRAALGSGSMNPEVAAGGWLSLPQPSQQRRSPRGAWLRICHVHPEKGVWEPGLQAGGLAAPDTPPPRPVWRPCTAPPTQRAISTLQARCGFTGHTAPECTPHTSCVGQVFRVTVTGLLCHTHCCLQRHSP